MRANVPKRSESRSESTDRRTKTRLRELCDEVLASYRVAVGSDVVTEAERGEARRLLAGIGALPAR